MAISFVAPVSCNVFLLLVGKGGQGDTVPGERCGV